MAVTTSPESTKVAAVVPMGKRIYGFLRSIPTWVLWIMVFIWSIPTRSPFTTPAATRALAVRLHRRFASAYEKAIVSDCT